MPHLVYPHLLQCEGHALLHIHPEVCLLPENLTGDQWSGRDHLVLLVKWFFILRQTFINPQTYSYPLILYNLVYVGPLVWIGLQTFYKNENKMFIESSEKYINQLNINVVKSNISLITLADSNSYLFVINSADSTESLADSQALWLIWPPHQKC